MLEKRLAWATICIAGAALSGGCRDPGSGTAATTVAPSSSGPGTATLSWEAPTANTNDSPLTDLAGYRIYYGSSPEQLSRTVEIKTIGLQTYVVDDLEPGTWFFAVKALAANGSESKLSDIVIKRIAESYTRPPQHGG